MTEPMKLKSTDGLLLEGLLDDPPKAKAGAVLCHPHPKMGGTMNAPMLTALTERFVSDGWAVLRFNFRGIGESEGEPSTGEAEVADALGAVSLMRERFTGLPLAIAGWSFGGAVAVRAAADDDSLAACVAIAPAVKPKPDVTAGLPPPEEIDLGVPLLIVSAANDHLVDPDDCRAWARGIPHATVVEVKGANHFFWAKYDDLGDAILGWLAEIV